MTDAKLTDRFGRPTTGLRISVTARCNFDCVYCHNEGQGPVQRASADVDELSVAEIEQVARVASDLGIRAFKLSGGEPLVRPDLEEIVEAVAPYGPVSMVTNGSMLAGRADGLAEAGLERINVSLDAMDAEVMREVGRGHVRPVLDGVHAAREAGLDPVKLNMVVMKQTLRGLDGILAFCREAEGFVLQLIQYMPERVGHPERGVPIEDVHERLASDAVRVEVREMHHRRIYHLPGEVCVEVVDPVENPEFCAHCQRLRVTARGELKGCLNRTDDEVSFRGMDDEGIRAVFRRVVAERMPYYPHYVRRQRERSSAPEPAAAEENP